MQNIYLKSKIHGATVTASNREYDGSITLDAEMIEAAALSVNEKVLVCNLDNGHRFETYVIEGGKGCVEVNGAAAHLAGVGDRIIVMSFCLLTEDEAKKHNPKIVKPGKDNRL
ncbi:MAG: aspartate 1-decarboxylase [Candidatus Altiarchaeales archaeon]|nr:aspartate 1-decarboxylase [Candidatus Altiarchaeales archaeon]